MISQEPINETRIQNTIKLRQKSETLQSHFSPLHEIENSFERAFWSIIKRSIELEASDIALIPREYTLEIRIRIDGIWREIMRISKEKKERFLQIAKELCLFNMGKKNETQDARFKTPENFSYKYYFRANIMPTVYGERIVLRLLESNKKFCFDSYSMPQAQKEILKSVLEKWQGMILCSGRTGSGKTTLLYSLLSQINRNKKNVFTLEQPVEYDLENVSQSEISEKMSWSDGLRALMRQSPDVILVGEIRDAETAEAAMHAAASGHLLFSTTHSNSAQESIDKLMLLGLKREMIEENLLFAGGQKLVPKNCPYCLVEDLESVGLIEKLIGKKIVPKMSIGCEFCHGTGVKGRVLLFESLIKENSVCGKKSGLVNLGSISQMAIEALQSGELSASTTLSILE